MQERTNTPDTTPTSPAGDEPSVDELEDFGDPEWGPLDGESLADALRRLPEEAIMERGAAVLPGIGQTPDANPG